MWKILVLICLLSPGLALNLTWTGLMNSSWHLAQNWNPQYVPSSFDNVYIGQNCSVPPYIDRPASANQVNNELMIDVYNAQVTFNQFKNVGLFCLYQSHLTVSQPMELIGQIRLIESVVNVSQITLTHVNSEITGAGVFHANVLNKAGTISLKREHMLTFQSYHQERAGKLNYELGQNMILSNNVILAGQIYVYSDYRNSYNQTIIQTVSLTLNSPKLVCLNYHTHGNLTLSQTPKYDLLQVNIVRN